MSKLNKKPINKAKLFLTEAKLFFMFCLVTVFDNQILTEKKINKAKKADFSGKLYVSTGKL